MSHNQAFFEPEAITVMTTAFEETLRTLGLVDRSGSAPEIVAKRSSNLPKLASAIPDLLCEGVLMEFRERRL